MQQLCTVIGVEDVIPLTNPNSPIGTTYTDEEFEKIINKAAAFNALVVIDEAYHYFYNKTQMNLIDKHENLIVLRTFSKLCSIAGLRIGYAAANPEIIQYIENAESTFNVSNISILFATEILKNPTLMDELIEIEKNGHRWLAENLKSKGYNVISNEGNYVLFYPIISSSELVARLKSNGCLVRDYSKGVLNGWVRISTGDISVMKNIFKEILNNDKF